MNLCSIVVSCLFEFIGKIRTSQESRALVRGQLFREQIGTDSEHMFVPLRLFQDRKTEQKEFSEEFLKSPERYVPNQAKIKRCSSGLFRIKYFYRNKSPAKKVNDFVLFML